MYFVVSDWFLGPVNNKFSFSEKFIESLAPNTPNDIKETKKNNLVQAIKNSQNNYVQTITPMMVDKVLKFQITLDNGTQEMVSGNLLKQKLPIL
eukprot:7637835-Ditylum_brightwellii.AAC.1